MNANNPVTETRFRGASGSSPASEAKTNGHSQSRTVARPIWFDLDNTPHVPFFEPILEELRRRGLPVIVTARDAFQVCELADKKGLQYTRIGRHYGKNRLFKIWGLAFRTLQMLPFALGAKPCLAVSHGSRSQVLLGNCLGIPTLLMDDYEHSYQKLISPTYVLTPSVIPDSSLAYKRCSFRKYPGIKEDVYAWKLKPDAGILRSLGIADSDIIAVVRPPATEAHYHDPQTDRLFDAVMERAVNTTGARVVLVPRNKAQEAELRQRRPKWFAESKTVVPRGAVDGLNLIWHSDLVVSGGGTMNREAAALGVPVYSIFRGTIGAVDQSLQSQGRLVLVETIEDVAARIRFEKRRPASVAGTTSKRTLDSIVDTIQQLAAKASN